MILDFIIQEFNMSVNLWITLGTRTNKANFNYYSRIDLWVILTARVVKKKIYKYVLFI